MKSCSKFLAVAGPSAFLESKLKGCREFVLNLMDNGSATEILSFKSQVANRVNDLTGLMERAPLEPVCTADATVSCIDSTKFFTMCQSVCLVFCSPDLPNCVVNKPTRHYIDDDGKLVNAVSVTVSLQDRHGNAVIGQCQHLQVTSALVSHVTVKEQDEGGVYNITYQPISVEADDVMIKWNGHDIIQCNVPALLRDYTALRVLRPVEDEIDMEVIKIKENSTDEEEIEDSDSDIIQCIVPALLRDYTALRVLRPVEYDEVIKIKESSTDEEEIEDSDSDIIQCNVPALLRDYTALRVLRPVEYDEVIKIKESSTDEEEIEDSDSESSVASINEEKRSEDNKLQIIAKYGPDGVEFGVVYSLCDGPNDELIVADYDNDKLIVFDKDLQYSHTIGEAVEGEGQFCGPCGVVCNKAGRLFVADRYNHRIQVFQFSGEFVTTFGTEGSKDGEFDEPLQLLLSSTGLLFVCDLNNKRVQVFNTQHDNQFQYSFAQGRSITDLTLNAMEDKLFAVDSEYMLVYTTQGQFLHSIAVDLARCGVVIYSICSTPDGHLLVGSTASSTLLSVYHEDGTLVYGGNTSDYTELIECAKYSHDKLTTAVHCTRNGQIVVFHELKIILL